MLWVIAGVKLYIKLDIIGGCQAVLCGSEGVSIFPPIMLGMGSFCSVISWLLGSSEWLLMHYYAGSRVLWLDSTLTGY